MRIVNKFQQGGPMSPEAVPADTGAEEAYAPEDNGGAEMPEGGEDPIMQIAQVAMQALETQDCEAAMAVCEAFIQLIQQGQGGEPEEAPEGEPVYRQGGVLSRRI